MTKSNRIVITTPVLPGVVFCSREAVLAHVHDALAIEAIRVEYEKSGDDITFAEAMESYGFAADEVAQCIASPKDRPAVTYMHL